MIALRPPHFYGRFVALLFLAGAALSGGAAPAPAPASPFETLLEAIRGPWRNKSAAELEKAAATGNAEAQFTLGLNQLEASGKLDEETEMWENLAGRDGKAPPTNDDASWQKEPLAKVKNAAQNGNRSAVGFLQRETERQADGLRATGIGWVTKAAEGGLACAQYHLAKSYFAEMGRITVPPNFTNGFFWLQKASAQNFEPAFHRQADLMLEGTQVPTDINQGLELIRKAADQDCPRAQYQLAMLYANGIGEPRQAKDTSLALLQRSALHYRYNKALRALADRYRWGLGVPANYLEAIRLYREAIQKDPDPYHPDASGAMQIISRVEEDAQSPDGLRPERAAFARFYRCYQAVFSTQEASAMKQMGDYYLEGKGVPQDSVQALAWYAQAVAQGNAAARPVHDQLKARLTPADQAEALRRQKTLLSTP